MIRVTAEPGRLTVRGHADYAPKGQDIVCAAVSALLLALAERLQEKNLVRELIMRPGYVTIAMRGAEREAEVINAACGSWRGGFPSACRWRIRAISPGEGAVIRVVAYHGKG